MGEDTCLLGHVAIFLYINTLHEILSPHTFYSLQGTLSILSFFMISVLVTHTHTHAHTQEYLWGLLWLRVRGNGQGCVAVWIFWLYYILLPRCLVGVMPCTGKFQKIIQKKRQKQIRDEDVSFILSFIYWVQQTFHGWRSFSWIHWNGWIPQLRCQKYVKSFHVCIGPHLVFRASIRVSFLLEVCQNPVRISL